MLLVSVFDNLISYFYLPRGVVVCNPLLFLPSSGMPAAYDLSTVIGSGPSVSHNNLIPLGKSHTLPDL